MKYKILTVHYSEFKNYDIAVTAIDGESIEKKFYRLKDEYRNIDLPSPFLGKIKDMYERTIDSRAKKNFESTLEKILEISELVD